MKPEELLKAVRESLHAIVDPRFYESERGFQGQLLVELSKRILHCIPGERVMLEHEHQKALSRHGLNIRPDIIVHQPFDPAIHATRRDGNFATLALKLRAGKKEAASDFDSLQLLLETLQYPIGIFINIDHAEHHADLIPEAARGRIISIATRLDADGVSISEAHPG